MLNISLKEKSKEGEKGTRNENIVVVCDVMKESVNSVKYFIKYNIGGIGGVLELIIPYICVLCDRNGMLSNWFLFIVVPLVLLYSVYVMKKVNMVFHNRTVDNIPLPYKRFTFEDNEGTVMVDEKRLQELLLYVNELENELERLGKI